MDCKQLQELAWSLELVKSTDGKGLRFAVASPTAQKWVSDGSTLMSGHRYCAALNLRAGTLPSGVRMDRGRNTDRRYCSAKCGDFEFLGQILVISRNRAVCEADLQRGNSSYHRAAIHSPCRKLAMGNRPSIRSGSSEVWFPYIGD